MFWGVSILIFEFAIRFLGGGVKVFLGCVYLFWGVFILIGVYLFLLGCACFCWGVLVFVGVFGQTAPKAW